MTRKLNILPYVLGHIFYIILGIIVDESKLYTVCLSSNSSEKFIQTVTFVIINYGNLPTAVTECLTEPNNFDLEFSSVSNGVSWPMATPRLKNNDLTSETF